MPYRLMELPYAQDALEPYISAETLAFHYGKHHAGYVDKLNALAVGTPFEGMALEQIVRQADGALFNNAAQVYNHDFYWHGLSEKQSTPSVELADMIEEQFGSIEAFRDAFLAAAAGLFGSGWVWLVMTNAGKLAIEQTANADTPIRHGMTPLLTCDVWEHAYYIDRRNARATYVENWWSVVNWAFVSDNLAEVTNDPIAGYSQPCNDDNEVCDYVDSMQANEETPS